jgi:hypothetical protein
MIRGMVTDPTPRRRFQFRLRTLLIGVTLFCALVGYVGSRAIIVRQRKAAIVELQKANGGVWYQTYGTPTPIVRQGQTVPALRRWMGDSPVSFVIYVSGTSPDLVRRLTELFPEAIVEEGYIHDRTHP